jgi:quercetin dioxygenase-like cupin family protein
VKKRKHNVAAEAHELALGLEPVAPSAGLRQRLMERIQTGSEFRLAVEISKSEGVWRPKGPPGVACKVLYHDLRANLTTMLLRMDPGATLPAHHHEQAEQCLVLEGEVQWQDKIYRAGDFLVAGAGTVHPSIYSDTGNTLLIVTGHTEFVVH